jgi:Ca-activated chloride channel family protein
MMLRPAPYRLGIAFVSIVLGSSLALHAQRPAFRLGVELVSLNVTVTAPDGRHVGDLSADDFTIFEEGQPQELAFFSRATAALSVSLVLDSSASMEQEMERAQRAAIDFVARLRPGDLAEIIDFDSRVQVEQPFTNDRAALEAAIRRVTAGGSTSLYNAVYITLRRFEQLRAPDRDEIRREVVVVLSDGDDTSSLVTYEEVLDLARRSQTAIYTIGLGLEPPGGRPTTSTGEFSLRRLAQDTGGRMFTARQGNELAGVYSAIADELTSQYVLGYLSTAKADGAFRRISVRVARPGLQARTRAGYYAPRTTRLQDQR